MSSRHQATEDYWGGHRPPQDEATLDDMGDWGGGDAYEHPEFYSHTGGGEPWEQETFRVLRSVRGKPDALVTIYRALPPGHTTIEPGDWVALSRGYCAQHAMQDDDAANDWPIIAAQVPAHTVRNGGNDVIEWGYWGPPVQARIGARREAMTDPGTGLPVGPNVFYRVHNRLRDFSVRDAWSAPVSFPYNERTGEYEPKWDKSRKRKGYSCFPDPWHLAHYVVTQGWSDSMDDMDVVAFEGKMSGQRGLDGEPLVIPTNPTEIVRLSWADFRSRLASHPRGGPPTWQGPVNLPRHPDEWNDQTADSILQGKMPTGRDHEWHVPGGREQRAQATEWTVFYGTNTAMVKRYRQAGYITPMTAEEGWWIAREAARIMRVDPAKVIEHMGLAERWFEGGVPTEVNGSRGQALANAQQGGGWMSWVASGIEETIQDLFREQDGGFRRETENARQKRYEKWFLATYRMEPHWTNIRVKIAQGMGWSPVLLTITAPVSEIKDWGKEKAYDPGNIDDRNLVIADGRVPWKYVTKVEELPSVWEPFSRLTSEAARAPLTASQGSDYSGHAMVCLRPSEGLRKRLADLDECTEDVDELHLTLRYLGEVDPGDLRTQDRYYRALYDFALHSGFTRLTGTLNGYGVFMNGEGEGNVLVGLWDVPNVAEFRASLTGYLRAHAPDLREDDHGFTPHSSLTYSDQPITRLPSLPEGDLEETFGSIWLVWGTEWTEVTLS